MNDTPATPDPTRDQFRRQCLDQAADAFDKKFDPNNQNQPATTEECRQRARELDRLSASWVPADFDTDSPGKVDRVIKSARDESARSVFLAWEKFRLAYNVILAGVVLLAESCLYGWSEFQRSGFWEYLVGGALYANACFCAGPWLDGWFAVAGAERREFRWVLFLTGLLLAGVFTVMALVCRHNKGGLLGW